MHLLKSFFLRLVTISFVLIIVLWLTPRWVEINQHKAGLLERLNRGAPGKLVVGNIQATLFPHLGIRAKEVELWMPSVAGTPSLFLAASAGEFRINSLTLLSATKQVDFATSKLEIRIQEFAPGKWNFLPLLGLASTPNLPSPQAKPQPKPRKKSAVEREVEQRSAQLLAGEYRPTPKPSAVQPLSSPTPFVDMKLLPTPLPERDSILENLDFRRILADSERIEIRFLNEPNVVMELSDLKIAIMKSEWLVSGIWKKDETAPWLRKIQSCHESALDSKLALRATVDPKGISMSEPWKGFIEWNGTFELSDGTNILAGNREQSSCRKEASQIR